MRLTLNVGAFVGTAVAFAHSGCAKTGRGVKDSDRIGALLGHWRESILAVDIDKLMAAYSENFVHDGADYGAKDKAGLREFIEGAIEQRCFEDVEVYMDDMAIALKEKAATVYPIEYTNAKGSVAIELNLTKEEPGWLITNMYIEGL